MSARAELYRRLARAHADEAAVWDELARLEEGAPAAPPAPPKSAPRRRARPGRVPSVLVPPPLTALDAKAAEIVEKKLRIAR